MNPPNPDRRTLLALAAVAAATAPLAAFAQSDAWPSRPIKLLVTSAAGGQTDQIARILAQQLQASLGQPVVVEAQGGANGMLATGTVAKAAPDGYTLLMTHGALVQNEALRPQKPYSLGELAPLAMVATLPIGFAINTSSGANSLADWVRLAKAEPQRFSYASYGQGSSGHVMGEILKRAAGLDIPHIAYRGGAPAAADLLAGHVSASFGALSDLAPHVPSGRVKIVAVTGSERNPRFPDVATFAEQGYPAVNLGAFTGVLAPAGLPGPVAERLTQEIQRAVRGPELGAKLNDIGYTPAPLNAQAFGAFLRTDIERWRQAVQANQIKID